MVANLEEPEGHHLGELEEHREEPEEHREEPEEHREGLEGHQEAVQVEQGGRQEVETCQGGVGHPKGPSEEQAVVEVLRQSW